MPVKSIMVTQDAKLKTTQIDADLGNENLPLSDVSLTCEDDNFLRRVEVLGRNVKSRTIIEPVENSQPRTRQVDEPWETLAGASVYRLPTGEGQGSSIGQSIAAFSGHCRYLQIRDLQCG